MKGLILAGGMATRLRPLSHTGPKQLVPIANKPVLYYIMEDLVNAGIKDIGIIVGYTPERIKFITDALSDGSRWGAKITYIEQSGPLGLAHAVMTAKDYLGDEPFVMYLGDNMLSQGIKEIVKEFNKNKPDASIMLCKVEDARKYGVGMLNDKGEIIDVEEKPEKPKSNLAIVGVYIFTKCIFDAIKKIKPGKNGELHITDAIQVLIKSKKKVDSCTVKGWWDDTGTSEAVLNANRLVLMELKHKKHSNIECDVVIKPPVSIGKDTIIRTGSHIVGPVIIGDNCEIGPDTYIGPFTSIGNNCKITKGEIESSVILDDVTIHFDEKIVNSLIGRHTHILSERKHPKGHKLILGEYSEVKL
jgi:glucose-1-phosphate thymidylyltransferase